MKWLSAGETLYNIKGKDENGKEVEVSRLKYGKESEFCKYLPHTNYPL